MNCLCCGKTITDAASSAEKEWQWHKKCVKKFFQTDTLPILDITKEQLETLARETVNEGLTVPGFNSVTTPRLVEVIVAYLKKNDYTPLIMHTENDIEEEIRCIERLKNMNVDGIMVLATGSTKEYEEAVKTGVLNWEENSSCI